jgi:hypothetical protein
VVAGGAAEVLIVGDNAGMVPLGVAVEVVDPVNTGVAVAVDVCEEGGEFDLLFLFAKIPPAAPPAAAAMMNSAIKAKTGQNVVFLRPQTLLGGA